MNNKVVLTQRRNCNIILIITITNDINNSHCLGDIFDFSSSKTIIFVTFWEGSFSAQKSPFKFLVYCLFFIKCFFHGHMENGM
jgi:hypothetical protein